MRSSSDRKWRPLNPQVLGSSPRGRTQNTCSDAVFGRSDESSRCSPGAIDRQIDSAIDRTLAATKSYGAQGVRQGPTPAGPEGSRHCLVPSMTDPEDRRRPQVVGRTRLSGRRLRPAAHSRRYREVSACTTPSGLDPPLTLSPATGRTSGMTAATGRVVELSMSTGTSARNRAPTAGSRIARVWLGRRCRSVDEGYRCLSSAWRSCASLGAFVMPRWARNPLSGLVSRSARRMCSVPM